MQISKFNPRMTVLATSVKVTFHLTVLATSVKLTFNIFLLLLPGFGNMLLLSN